MSFAPLHAFMCERDPDFGRSCKPVPREDIAACEQRLGLALPTAYVEMLVAMGAGSGRYQPFGSDQDHDFYGLLERLDFARYPTDRYFRVALQIDDSLDVIQEPYLDLGRAAGDDTPLVTIYDAGPFSPDDVYELNRTLTEVLTINVFNAFLLASGADVVGLSNSVDSPRQAPALRDAAVARLQALGLAVVLPPLARVVCLEGGDVAALVELHGDRGTVLAIDINGRDSRTVKAIAEAVAAGLPGTTRNHAARMGLG